MPAHAISGVRLVLIHLAANLNLILGGLAIAFGAYVLVAGADAMGTVMQAGDAGADALAKVAPAGDAKKASDVLALASKGVGAVFLAMAGIFAGCAIAQGLPLVLVGVGLLCRQGWARVFGILFGILGLLEGLACLGGSGGTRGVLVTGGVFTVYGLVSLFGLIGGSTAAYFSRSAAEPGEQPAPPANGRWALVGVLASTLLVAVVGGLAISGLQRGGPPPAPNTAHKKVDEELHGVWETGPFDPHQFAFTKDGALYFVSDRGSSKGTYKLASANSLDFEYELPEAVFQAQKAAFDFAKKAADNPDNPLRGVFDAVEPIRTIKDRVRFTLDDAEGLTLHHAKRAMAYRRSEVALAAIEKQYGDQVIALAKLKQLADKVDPKKLDPLNILPKLLPKDDADKIHAERLASLHDAIAKGQIGRVKTILAPQLVGVNDRDEKGETPLMKAVQSGYIDVVKELLTHGADWSVTDREGNNLFLHAIAIGRLEWLLTGIGLNSDPRTVVLRGQTINWATEVQTQKHLKKLNGYMVGAAAGQLGDLKFIYEIAAASETRKAVLAWQDRDGKTALDHAQAKGHKNVVTWLEEVTGTKVGAAPIPVVNEPTELVLPDTEVSRNEKVDFIRSARAGNLDYVDEVLRKKLNDKIRGRPDLLMARDVDNNNNGETALMIAAGRGDSTMVLLLCKHIREIPWFAGLRYTDGKARTAFHHAVEKGDPEVLEHLCTLSMLGWKDYSGNKHNWFRVVQATDGAGKTALEHAEEKGKTAAAKVLKDHYQKGFEATTYVPWASNVGYTAMELACHQGDAATVKELLKMGCPVQRPKYEYHKGTLPTPLMMAAKEGHIAAVKALIDSFGDDGEKKRAYLAIKDGGGNATAEQWATGANQPEVAAILKRHAEK